MSYWDDSDDYESDSDYSSYTCDACNCGYSSSYYSSNQLRKGSARRCMDCVDSGNFAPTYTCSACGTDYTQEGYSRNQLNKGPDRRCVSCVDCGNFPFSGFPNSCGYSQAMPVQQLAREEPRSPKTPQQDKFSLDHEKWYLRDQLGWQQRLRRIENGSVMTLYHQTDEASADSILTSQEFRRGTEGSMGAGIYFAKTPQATDDKTYSHGVVLQCKVKIGRTKPMHDVDYDITFSSLFSEKYDSVKGMCFRTGEEWVVYNKDQVFDITLFRKTKGFGCRSCTKKFDTLQASEQHQLNCLANQAPKELKCPTCANKYRQVAHVAQHFESGQCPGCYGEANAKKTVYGFVASQKAAQQFLTNPQTKYLKDLRGETRKEVASQGWQPPNDHNYRCPACSKSFQSLSSLLQHQQNKPECARQSGNHRMISMF